MVQFNNKFKEHIKNVLKKRGVEDVSAVDISALWDSSLTYYENKTNILESLNLSVSSEHIREEDFIAQGFAERTEKFDARFGRTEREEFKGLMKEIEDFSPHTEKITLSTMIAVNQRINLINVSKAGYGKSWGTKEVLKRLDVPFKEIEGHITPKQFFKALENNFGEVLLIDESASLLSNDEIINLLLQALWSGSVAWNTAWGVEKCDFNGVIIFNTNSIRDNAFIDALKDRVLFNHVKLSDSQIKDKIRSRRTYETNQKAWSVLSNNILSVQDLTAQEEDFIYELLEKIPTPSVRVEWRLKKIAKGLKAIFGEIGYLKQFISSDKIWIIATDNTLKRSEKVKRIAKLKKVSKRQARNIMKEFEGF